MPSYDKNSAAYKFQLILPLILAKNYLKLDEPSFLADLLPMIGSHVSNDNPSNLSEHKCTKNRNSRPDIFCKKGALRNFSKFTGKHLCQSLFFNKFAGLTPVTLLKKKLWQRCFPMNFAKFLRTPFYRTPLDDCFFK